MCFDGSQGIEGNDEEMDAVSTPVSITPIFLRVVMGGTPKILPMRPGGERPRQIPTHGGGNLTKKSKFPGKFLEKKKMVKARVPECPQCTKFN